MVSGVGGEVKGGGASKDDAQLARTKDGFGEGEVNLSVKDGPWTVSSRVTILCCEGDRESVWGEISGGDVCR